MSRTGTKTHLDLYREWGWRILVSARGVHSSEGFPYAIDNGAWTSYTKEQPFDEDSFLRVVRWGAAGADWLVLPDVVRDAAGTFAAAERWIPRLRGIAPLYFVVQDDMVASDVEPVVGDLAGIFVGGGDEFKEGRMREWCSFARDHGLGSHVGRVNSKRRIAMCQEAGADSFDGSGAAKFIKHAHRINRWCVELGVTWR